MATRLLHLKEVLRLTSLSRTSIYRLMARGRFPDPIELGARRAWVEAEVATWIDARIAATRGAAA